MAENNRDIVLQTIKFEEDVVTRILQCLTDEEVRYVDQFQLNREMLFNLYLQQGCKALGWYGDTAVVVKYYLMPDTVYEYAERLDAWHKRNLPEGTAVRLVIIFKTFSPVVRPIAGMKVPSGIEVYTWNAFLKRIKERTDEEGYDIVAKEPKDVKWVVNNVMVKLSNQWLIREEARRAFERERVTLFLGAGVSVDAGLPKWNELLVGMFKRKGRKPFEYISDKYADDVVKACNNSSIIVGRYAYNGYGNMARFSERIKDVLYENQHNSRLVDELCDVIASEKGHRQISHVITYNYDDLIETGLDKIGYKEYYSVYGKNRNAAKKLPIYHVHGMIPQRELISSTPILSEKDYHELYKNNHNWANVVQLYSMNNTTCFFIGLSMNDPNLRRLLDFSRSEEGNSPAEIDRFPHYVFLKKEQLGEDVMSMINQEHWEKQEAMMKEFGINIIWYNEHSELPDLIGQIMLK